MVLSLVAMIWRNRSQSRAWRLRGNDGGRLSHKQVWANTSSMEDMQSYMYLLILEVSIIAYIHDCLRYKYWRVMSEDREAASFQSGSLWWLCNVMNFGQFFIYRQNQKTTFPQDYFTPWHATKKNWTICTWRARITMRHSKIMEPEHVCKWSRINSQSPSVELFVI